MRPHFWPQSYDCKNLIYDTSMQVTQFFHINWKLKNYFPYCHVTLHRFSLSSQRYLCKWKPIASYSMWPFIKCWHLKNKHWQMFLREWAEIQVRQPGIYVIFSIRRLQEWQRWRKISLFLRKIKNVVTVSTLSFTVDFIWTCAAEPTALWGQIKIKLELEVVHCKWNSSKILSCRQDTLYGGFIKIFIR